ncbi:hypothetical protein GCM10009525_35210 [Streptosporangium amethystogenes subsp. fukuiense]
MERIKSAVISLTGTGMLLMASIAMAPGAQAEVWDCGSSYSADAASAYCDGGYGSYRVKANCASPRYPYNITIYGPTVTKLRNDQPGPVSSVSAVGYNCNITSASVQV